MPLKIVTGGTTGAADGTLVSSGNHFALLGVDTVLDLHVRCDDDTYSTDTAFTLPSDGSIEVSFNGGSTWKGSADSPYVAVTGVGLGGTDIGDLNIPFKVRQHASTATVSGAFTTDGTYVAATGLADVTSFVVTPGSGQNVLTWTAVTNRTAYRVDRALDSGFTTGVALDISPGLTATTLTDTGRTNGTTYYYRIKAVGTYRYKDSASYATGNGAPILAPDVTETFTGSAAALGTKATDTGGKAWVAPAGYSRFVLDGSGHASPDTSDNNGVAIAALNYSPPTADVDVEWVMGLHGPATNDYVAGLARMNSPTAPTSYVEVYMFKNAGDVYIGAFDTAGMSMTEVTVASLLGSYSDGTRYTFRMELTGTTVVLKINGVTAFTGTTSITATGRVGIRSASNFGRAATLMTFDSLAIYHR